MNGLAARQQGGLPAKPDDLAKFIVISQEKLKSVKAEIRAIRRLNMAKEVYDQKVEEQARLQELTLLAYQRMGEITREIPTSAGGRPSAKKSPSAGTGCERSKSQAIHDLGLSTSQIGRMEQIADHPDVVAAVIAASRAGQAKATQTEVLRRIKGLKGTRDANTEEDHQEDAKLKLFRRVTGYQDLCKITDEVLDAVVASRVLRSDLDRLDETIRLMSGIRERLLEKVQISSRCFFESIALKEELDEPPLKFVDE